MFSSKEIINSFRHLLYPRLCEGCEQPLLPQENVLCLSCLPELPETNYHTDTRNESVLRLAGRFPFEHVTSYAYFTTDGLLQHLMHRLKYGERKEIATFLGRQLGLAIRDTEWARTIDIILPIPLHAIKEGQRGYNQSMLIAAGISGVTGIPASERYLFRDKHTESQTHKTRAERVNNMKDAFSVAHTTALSGKHILLCDDVLTTGATIEACALVLLAIKSVKISVATVGIAIS